MRWALPAVFLTAAACGGHTPSPAAPGTPSNSAPTVVSVQVTGTAPYVGGSQPFQAKATLSDGSTLTVTASSAWQSSNAGVATVDAGGVAHGTGAGEADLTATYQGASASAHVAVIYEPPVLSETVVDLSGTYDPATRRLGALDCNYEFADSPDDRWCFDAFGNTSIPGKVVPSFDYKVVNGSVAVVAAAAGTVTAIVPHEDNGYVGEFAVNTRLTPDSPYLIQYDHVRSVAVSVGTVVSPGTRLGTVGVLRTWSNTIQGRVEMQINKRVADHPTIVTVNLCPAQFGTSHFNSLNNAALAAHNDANPMYAQPSVCVQDSVPGVALARRFGFRSPR